MSRQQSGPHRPQPPPFLAAGSLKASAETPLAPSDGTHVRTNDTPASGGMGARPFCGRRSSPGIFANLRMAGRFHPERPHCTRQKPSPTAHRPPETAPLPAVPKPIACIASTVNPAVRTASRRPLNKADRGRIRAEIGRKTLRDIRSLFPQATPVPQNNTH